MGRRGEGEAWSSALLTGYRALRTGWLRAEFQQVRRGRSGRRRGSGAGEAREAREGAPGGRSRGEGEAWSSAPLTGYRALRTGWLRAEFQQVRRGRSGREAWARAGRRGGGPGRPGDARAGGRGRGGAGEGRHGARPSSPGVELCEPVGSG